MRFPTEDVMQTAPSRDKIRSESRPLAADRVLRARRQDYVDDLFNRTAQHYNTIESLFLNGGLWYRRFG